jgi:glycosyltransferase involved in cell wall biosynthesis
MKILQIVKTNDGARWAFNQAQWLSAHGVEVIVVLPQDRGGMADLYIDSGIKVIKADFSLPVTSPWKLVSRVTNIRRVVEEIKPDIIHCHFVTNIMMIRLALGRHHPIPRFFQVPGPLHLESIFFRRAETMLSGKSDYWGGACQRTCDIYKRINISSERIFLAYYGGYGGQVIEEYAPSTGQFRRELGIATDVPLIGMISYFYKPKYHLFQFRGLKGHEDFIDAIAILKRIYPNLRAVIIGGPWGNASAYMDKIKRIAHKKCGDSIVFAGFRCDMKQIYRELDIAVHPSLSENLGGAAESLAAGVPTIATCIGGFPDIVQHEVTGLLVNPKSPNEIANEIIKLVKDKSLAEKMALNGKTFVKNLLDIGNTAKNIKRIYEVILENNNNRPQL